MKITTDKFHNYSKRCFACFILLCMPVNSNVVILLADDLGKEFEVYGQPACKTPHLLSLARRGVVYDKAWTVVSSCSPSRSSVLTGLPPHQNGMYGLHQGYHNYQSFRTVWTLPNLLRSSKIRTGIIGKKHVGPSDVFKFDFEETEENNSVMQVGRNITLIRHLIKTFLSVNNSRPFLLYIGFHDPHRCGHTNPEYGQFCEKFGDGSDGMGRIPDWTPVVYTPDKVHVPYYVQNTAVARSDLAAQYTTISRLDQGVGVVLQELEWAGVLETSLIIFSSDNGSPYPSGRTNTYEPGLQIPLIVSSPSQQKIWNSHSDDLVSLLDITPTVLEWFNVPYPNYTIFNNDNSVVLSGRSLLSTTDVPQKNKLQYASHSLHEITMYYPMRAVRSQRFKLIQNIAYRLPFPIDQDFYISPVFQDILNRSTSGQPLPWYKSLYQYYYRPQWELYDLSVDPKEIRNVAGNVHYKRVLTYLQIALNNWQNATDDPWICSPGAVLQDSGLFKSNHTCMALYNGM